MSNPTNHYVTNVLWGNQELVDLYAPKETSSQVAALRKREQQYMEREEAATSKTSNVVEIRMKQGSSGKDAQMPKKYGYRIKQTAKAKMKNRRAQCRPRTADPVQKK